MMSISDLYVTLCPNENEDRVACHLQVEDVAKQQILKGSGDA